MLQCELHDDAQEKVSFLSRKFTKHQLESLWLYLKKEHAVRWCENQPATTLGEKNQGEPIRKDEEVEVLHGMGKKQIIRAMMAYFFKNGFNLDDTARIDLYWVREKIGLPTWRAYELTGIGSNETNKKYQHQFLGVEPALVDSFKEELNPYFPQTHCYGYLQNGLFWLRIHILEQYYKTEHEIPLNKTSNVIFLIHVPGSKHIVLSKIAQRFLPVILQSIRTVFYSSSLRELDLSSNNYVSILDMLQNQYCQGIFKEYQAQNIELRPLESQAVQKRRRVQKYLDHKKQENSEKIVVVEDRERVEKLAAIAALQFGLENQPQLQRVQFKMHETMQLDDDTTLPAMFEYKASFYGKDVLRGFRTLVANGLAPRMPKYITQLSSLAKNTIVVQNGKLVMDPADLS